MATDRERYASQLIHGSDPPEPRRSRRRRSRPDRPASRSQRVSGEIHTGKLAYFLLAPTSIVPNCRPK